MENSKPLKVLDNLVDCTTFSRLHSTYSSLGTLLNAITNLKRSLSNVMKLEFSLLLEAGTRKPEYI